MVNSFPSAAPLGTVVLNVLLEILYFSSNKRAIWIGQDTSNLQFCSLKWTRNQV